MMPLVNLIRNPRSLFALVFALGAGWYVGGPRLFAILVAICLALSIIDTLLSRLQTRVPAGKAKWIAGPVLGVGFAVFAVVLVKVATVLVP